MRIYDVLQAARAQYRPVALPFAFRPAIGLVLPTDSGMTPPFFCGIAQDGTAQEEHREVSCSIHDSRP